MNRITKLIALSLASVMAACSLAACNHKESETPTPTDAPSAAPTVAPTEAAHDHDHDHNHGEDPSRISIGRVGTVEYTMADYLNIYDMYSYYAAYISDLHGMIKDQLTESGVLLTRCDELGIDLDDEDELTLQKQLDDELEYALSQMEVDYSIEDEDKLREAQMQALEEMLTEYGYTFDSYFDEVREDMRKAMRVQKLRDLIAEEIEFGEAQIEEYYEEQLAADTEKYGLDPYAYSNAFNAYLTGQERIPLYTPEDMFTVKHLLIQFENTLNVPDEEGVFGDGENRKLDEVRSALESGITLEEFIENFVSSADYNSDATLTPPDPEEVDAHGDYMAGYREHGYIMHETLIGNYYPGFGEAACVLKFGEDWMPSSASEDSAPSSSPIEQYGIKFYETTDGHRIAEVRSDTANGGIHFIFINEEFESGESKLDMGNENDPVYASVKEYCRKGLEQEHYHEALQEWTDNTNIEFDDELIEHYISEHYGVG
ncbi:MAG: hypothetical protein IKZ82_10005 [Clostridia bacterium]|nr:hypothetical protein [Clostridia bacterium]